MTIVCLRSSHIIDEGKAQQKKGIKEGRWGIALKGAAKTYERKHGQCRA